MPDRWPRRLSRVVVGAPIVALSSTTGVPAVMVAGGVLAGWLARDDDLIDRFGRWAGLTDPIDPRDAWRHRTTPRSKP